MKTLKSILFATLISGLSINAYAQNIKTDNRLTIERVFSDPALSGPNANNPQLSPDGSILTYLKPKTEDVMVQDLWAVDIKNGAPFVLVDANKLSNPAKELSEEEKGRRERLRLSSRGVVEYKWDETGKAVLVPLDGDIFAADAKTHEIKRLTQTPQDEIDAKLSPNGNLLGFVRENELIIKDLQNNSENHFSPKASENISYGTADFIAEEEQDRHTGYWWAPDSSKIAFTKVDETNVDTIPRFEISGAGVKVISQKYPRAGRPNAVVELYVKSLPNGEMVKVDLGDNKDIYLARVNWAPDAKSLYVQRLSRNQQVLDLLQVDIQTGKSKTILTETSDTWVELSDDFRLLKSGDFIWPSERDGNNHLYLYDKNAKFVRQITKGDFPIKRIAAINEDKGLIFVMASPKTPIETGLYVTSLKGDKPLSPITNEGGVWNAAMAKSGQSFIGTYSDTKTPPNVGLYDASGKRLRFIEENALNVSHPFYPYKDTYSAPEFGILKSDDNQDLQYSMLKPLNFDPSKKYPAIVYIYGGPAKAMVTKSWVAPSLRLYQDAGYVVFTLDNRGTPDRSKKFTRAIYKKFGGPDIDDQIKGAKFLQSLPYIDGKRIGITGWSQGGFVTLMAMTAKDTPFAAGVAGAPPTQWGLYDTAYTERYMAMPDENKDGYAQSDVLNRLHNLKPNSLMIMHGMADDNVLFDNTTRVIAALQAKSIPFETMLYPGEKHGLKGNAKKKHQFQSALDFFDRHLKAN